MTPLYLQRLGDTGALSMPATTVALATSTGIGVAAGAGLAMLMGKRWKSGALLGAAAGAAYGLFALATFPQNKPAA